MNPFVLTIPITEVTTEVQLVPGWNWFSVNATGEEMTLNTVLSSVNGSMDYIKSQTSYSEYYDSYGWWELLKTSIIKRCIKQQLIHPMLLHLLVHL